MTRAELIKALESLDVPSREMDGRIQFVVRRDWFGTDQTGAIGYYKRHSMGITDEELFCRVYRDDGAKDMIPRYTSSIDSALTLGRNEVERRAILGAIYDNANETYTIARCILFGCAHALRLREESTNEEA